MSFCRFAISLLAPYRHRLVLCLAALIILSGLGIFPPLLFGWLLDIVIAQGRYELLGPIILGLFAARFFALGLQAVSDYTIASVAQRVLFDLRLKLYRSVHRLSSNYLNNTSTGAIMERLRGDVGQLQMVLGSQTLFLMVQGVYGVIAFTIMAVISLKLAFFVALAAGLYIVSYRMFVRRIRVVQKRHRRQMDRLSGRAQEKLAGQIVVKSAGHEREEARTFLRQNFITQRVFLRFRRLNIAYSQVATAISVLSRMAILLLGVRLVIAGELTYGMLMALMTYAQTILQPIVQLAELSNQLQQAKIALTRIWEQMQQEPDVTETPGHKLPGVRGEVVFDDVHFAYEPEKPVLQGLSFTAQPGQTIALVGETGCGKSTITNLLYRFYDIDAGSLRVDGHELRDLDASWYRRQIGIVPQEAIVFNTSLRDNLLYGDPHATDEQLIDAATDAELGELLERLPEGLDTVLGDEGFKLSTGEKQRLCIARAILSRPAIIILDEATSSLDPASETLIQKALERVMQGRTSFVIAHRLSTIAHADQILVLEKGRVREQGNHHELMAADGGRYRMLFETQMNAERKTA